MQWFLIVSHQQKEKWAKRELENQGFIVYLPMCCAFWAKKPRIRPFLPTYLFVKADLDDRTTRWRAIWSTFGVKSVVCSGDKPSPIADYVIDEIMDREVNGLVLLPPRRQCKYEKGMAVRVNGSPLDAVFEEAIDYKRAAIFVSLLGRMHRKVVPIDKLRSAPSVAVASA